MPIGALLTTQHVAGVNVLIYMHSVCSSNEGVMIICMYVYRWVLLHAMRRGRREKGEGEGERERGRERERGNVGVRGCGIEAALLPSVVLGNN